ncbi:MAG: ferrous iron transport protein A [Promethearchaeota archaeon]
MNQKGTPIETTSHIPLTSVDSGKECCLVGISNSPRLLGHYRKHGRRLWGFGGHNETRERQRRSWHEQGQRLIMKRLLDLGLTKGCTFKVVQNRGRGPVLVEVRGTRIALGHGLASKVIVEVMEGQK